MVKHIVCWKLKDFAEGKTKVTNIQYIDRGYENFVENLQFLGAKIKRVKQ